MVNTLYTELDLIHSKNKAIQSFELDNNFIFNKNLNLKCYVKFIYNSLRQCHGISNTVTQERKYLWEFGKI